MPFEFALPQLSTETEEGIVVAWFKREGAQVQEGENLLEVQLAKVSYDIPAPVSGTLYRVLAPRDAVIRQGQVLALILRPGEEAPAEAKAAVVGAAAAAGSAAAVAAPPAREVRASPAARRLAKEHGIDLATVRAAAADGRITESDVQAAIAARAEARPARTEALSPMRKIIARRMMESLRTSAQLTLTSEADVTELVGLRERLKQEYDVTYTDLIVKAAARALAAHPRLNARWSGDDLELPTEVNIGLAVSTDQGLIVPVVKDVSGKSLPEIAAETKRLAEKARAGTLTEQELTGGTFTVTNLGMYGIDAFTPIINPPEVAILGVGRIVARPAPRDGGLEWRQMLTLSLTFDHRAVDGAPAAEFLQTVRTYLEQPAELGR